ncbi:MAG: OsmC family protein [Ignavibacteria bacterium]
MKVIVKLNQGMKLIGFNEKGHQTFFDSHPDVGGEDSAATPMEVFLEALGACTSMDVLSMLRKRKKTICNFEISLEATRAPDHPKVFTKVILAYKLESPDTTKEELEYVIKLSQDKYCTASAMFKHSGCEIIYTSEIT